MVSFQRKDEKQRKELLKFWKNWLKNPVCPTVSADKLTPDELEEFIAKDNVVVGEWDYAKMEKWDLEQIQDWGVEVEMPKFGDDEGNLPPELQGRDLMPDDLEKLQGDDRTEYNRVIICYKPNEEKAVAEMLGLDIIERIVYKYSDLK